METPIPEYWSITRTEENYKIINKYMNSLHGTVEGGHTDYTDSKGEVNNQNVWKSANELPRISFEQFQQYVLNKHEELNPLIFN